MDATAFYRRAAAGFPRSYYSARAVLLGHREQVQLKERSARIASTKTMSLR